MVDFCCCIVLKLHAWIWRWDKIYVLKLKLWLGSDSVSKSSSLRHIHCLAQWVSNFHEPWPPFKFNWRMLNISWHLRYTISRRSYLAKVSARGPQRGPRAPFEKPWFSNNSIHSIYLFVMTRIVTVQSELCGALTF